MSLLSVLLSGKKERDSSLISTVIYRKSLWERPLGWLGLTAGKPQGGGLRVWGVASGSAASHPNSGSPDLVEFGEESRKINPFLPTRCRPTVEHSLAARDAQRQWLQAAA